MREVRENGTEHNPAAMVITETKLSDSVTSGQLAVPRYELHRVDRDQAKAGTKSGGGVMLYLRGDLQVTQECTVKEADMEMFAANVPELQLRIVAIYRRPNRHITSESLSQIRKQLSKPGRSIVVGDLNLDSRLARPEPQTLWCELLEAGLSQRVRIITHPPRHAGEKASTITTSGFPKKTKLNAQQAQGACSTERAITSQSRRPYKPQSRRR